MRKYVFCLSIMGILIQTACLEKNEPTWFLKATYYEGCSCTAPCPCPYGLPMSNSFCKLNGLVDIHEGEFNNIDLSGTRAILSGSVGDWGEYYFDTKTTDEQMKALEELFKIVDVTGFKTILKSQKAKINFSNQKGKVLYSTPNIAVELDMVRGLNDTPVIVQNLKSILFNDYTPHLAVENRKNALDSSFCFSFTQKAGYSAKWDITNKNFKKQNEKHNRLTITIL